MTLPRVPFNRASSLRLVASNGALLDDGFVSDAEYYALLDPDVDEETFETAALASDAFASVFGKMRDHLERGECLRTEGLVRLRVAFDEYLSDLERKRMTR